MMSRVPLFPTAILVWMAVGAATAAPIPIPEAKPDPPKNAAERTNHPFPVSVQRAIEEMPPAGESYGLGIPEPLIDMARSQWKTDLSHEMGYTVPMGQADDGSVMVIVNVLLLTAVLAAVLWLSWQLRRFGQETMANHQALIQCIDNLGTKIDGLMVRVEEPREAGEGEPLPDAFPQAEADAAPLEQTPDITASAPEPVGGPPTIPTDVAPEDDYPGDIVGDFRRVIANDPGKDRILDRWKPIIVEMMNFTERARERFDPPRLEIHNESISQAHFWLILQSEGKGYLVPSETMYRFRGRFIDPDGFTVRILFSGIFDQRPGPAFDLEEPAEVDIQGQQVHVVKTGSLLLSQG